MLNDHWRDNQFRYIIISSAACLSPADEPLILGKYLNEDNFYSLEVLWNLLLFIVLSFTPISTRLSRTNTRTEEKKRRRNVNYNPIIMTLLSDKEAIFVNLFICGVVHESLFFSTECNKHHHIRDMRYSRSSSKPGRERALSEFVDFK